MNYFWYQSELTFHGILHVSIYVGTHGAPTFAIVVGIEVHVSI
jgi:hypothetical protein